MPQIQIAEDDFNRADGAIGANWTDQAYVGGLGPPVIAGNLVTATASSGMAWAFWNVDVFPDAQWSQITVLKTNHYSGPTVRASGTGASLNGYFAHARSTGINLVKVVNNVETEIAIIGPPVVDGDIVRIAVVGSTIQCFINGIQAGENQTDSDLVSGSAGFAVAQFPTAAGAVDNWSGGEAALEPPRWTTSGPNSGAVAALIAGGGTAWSTPENALVADDVNATVTLDISTLSNDLWVRDFGFNLPPGVQIVGIVVETKVSAAGTNTVGHGSTYLSRNFQGPSGDPGSGGVQLWPTTPDYVLQGGVDELWGQVWSATDIESPYFGACIKAFATAAGTARVDHVRISVYYESSNTPQGIARQFQAGDGMSTNERHSLIRQH